MPGYNINPVTGKRQIGRPFQPGVSGNPGGSAGRARRELNADTIRAMHKAFREGGEQVIRKVTKNQPAVFLKLLVLLVPREMEVTHSNALKTMSDDAIEATIQAIQEMLARREAGEHAKVVEGTAETVALPAPTVVPDGPNKIMDAPDTAVGARKRKPGKGRVPSPAGARPHGVAAR